MDQYLRCCCAGRRRKGYGLEREWEKAGGWEKEKGVAVYQSQAVQGHGNAGL
jgi:hypothetical protein